MTTQAPPRTRNKPAPPEPDPVITIATNSEFPGITSRLIRITAADAEEMWKLNRRPRVRRARQVSKIKRDILNGKYIVDGIPICLEDPTGEDDDVVAALVQNGQHRLAALMEAQREENLNAAAEGRPPLILSIATFITEGLSREARRTQDTNAGLSAQDWLALSGRKYAALTAAVAKFIVQFEAGERERGLPGASTQAPSNAEVDDVLSEHPEIIPICHKVSQWSTDKVNRDMVGFPPAVAAFVMWQATYSDLVGGWKFMEQLWQGNIADPDSPILAFRKKHQLAYRLRKDAKYSRLDALKWALIALNCYVDGRGARDVNRAGNKTIAAQIPAVKGGPRRGEKADASHWEDMLDQDKLNSRLGILPGGAPAL